MPTSITRGGHEHVGARRRRTRAIAACFSRGRIWPCISTTRKSRELGRRAGARTRRSPRAPAAPRTPRPAGRRRSLAARRAAPRGCARRRARARARRATTWVSTGRRPAGQLAQRGDVEVAVGGERERARDRRRGHVQHVRREARPAPCGRARARWRTPKRCCSSTTATREAVELDGVLDQRVRADEQPQLAACASLPSRSARRARGRRAGEQRGRHAARRASARWSVAKCCSASVSVGAISAACMPVLDGAQHRVQRDDGLARADLAHQQALHRALGRSRRRSPPSRAAGRRSARTAATRQPAGGELGRPASGSARAPSRRALPPQSCL